MATKPATVKIKLYKDGHEFSEDAFAAMNGRTFQVKRGIEVEVPAFIAEIFENSAKQDQRTADMIMSMRKN